jgi:oligosaccharyltransferase complex subunit delta (ribophorin II)
MRISQSIAPALLLFAAGAAQAASAWGFDDGSVAVVAKKAGETAKQKYAIPKHLLQDRY